jgi:hypothetical protein
MIKINSCDKGITLYEETHWYKIYYLSMSARYAFYVKQDHVFIFCNYNPALFLPSFDLI